MAHVHTTISFKLQVGRFELKFSEDFIFFDRSKTIHNFVLVLYVENLAPKAKSFCTYYYRLQVYGW